ncbi:MAG: hypothetical protein M3457_21740 [Chloroflexota bacterium]|nr:hypothetical protein [Chloroflexota bacterium]
MSKRGFTKRLNIAFAAWGFDSARLAERAGWPLPIVANALSGVGNVPDLSDTKRLADVLHVYEQWLRCGDIAMVPMWEMTVEDQHRAQTGPGTEGLPGYVFVEPGPWFTDAAGKWIVRH